MMQNNGNESKKRERLNDELNEYQRLRERYQDQPFHERNFAWYWIAIVSSWLSNIISGLTESAKLFALFFSIFGNITYGFPITFLCMCIGIVGIELTHRTFARSYFKQYAVHGGHSREQNGNLIGMISCLLLSLGLSVSGQFDGLRFLIHPPEMAIAEQMDIDKVNKTIAPIVQDAKQRVDNYYNRRKYQGRIAREDKRKYREYEDHAITMEDSLMSMLMRIPDINNGAKEKVRQQYQKDVELYEQQIQSKGIGLLFFTLPAILILYLSLWFEEKYIKKKADYLAYKFKFQHQQQPLAAFYPIRPIEETSQSVSSTEPQLDNNGKLPETKDGMNGIYNTHKTPIGYYTKAQKRANELLQYVATRINTEYSQEKTDRYTILHFNFKTGEPIRYPKERVNWYVKNYTEKVKDAEKNALGQDVFINRKSKLIYWQARQKELYEKME